MSVQRFMPAARQRGTTLVVALLMLIVLTGLAVTAVNLTSLNLKMAGNMQDQMRAEGAAQLAVDNFISSLAAFDETTKTEVSHGGYTVEISAPDCLASEPALGWEENYTRTEVAGNRFDTHWELKASVIAGAVAGEVAVMQQGVRLKDMLAKCGS